MQQSILALGALLIIMMTAINHQRSTLLVQEASYIREMENAAADLAEMRIESILNLASFDESTAGGITSLPGNTNSLSNTLGPESGEAGPSDSQNTLGTFDDIDDFHGFQQSYWHTLGADSFRFVISYSVQYVNPSTGAAAGAPSFAKELSANVVSLEQIGPRSAQVTFSKLASISDDL